MSTMKKDSVNNTLSVDLLILLPLKKLCMRKVFTLIVFSIISYSLFSQNYLSNNLDWAFFTSGGYPGYFSDEARDWFFVSGDTTINSVNYYQLYQSTNYKSYNADNILLIDTNYPTVYYAAIREAGTKLYIINSGSFSELLWWDFGFSIGDTIKVSPAGTGACDDTAYTIAGVDSVTFGAVTRKVFSVKLLSNLTDIKVYEGIGVFTGDGQNDGGPFEQLCNNGFVSGDEPSGGLICYSIDGNELRFDNGQHPEMSCTNPFTAIKEMSEQHGAKIYPNPATDFFEVKLAQLPVQHTELLLFNSLGQLVKEQQIMEEDLTVYCKNFSSGMYFWQIASNNQIASYGKIIFE